MTDEPTIRIRDGSMVTREEYDKSEQYVQEVQKAKANRQVKPDSSLDMTELSSRLRLLQRYHGDNDAGEAADALEAQARRIAELESMIAVHRLAVDVDALKVRIAELEDDLNHYRVIKNDAVANMHKHVARIAELEAALKDTTVRLVAAISLLERGGKKAAPSNKMFEQMLVDYKNGVERARAALGEKE